jgi:hypothetical protein
MGPRAAESIGRGNHVLATITALVVLLETLAKASDELSWRAEHATLLLRESEMKSLRILIVEDEFFIALDAEEPSEVLWAYGGRHCDYRRRSNRDGGKG